jgi:Arc/MetJ-type ribon-helix-helix transcriptional regulator
MKVKTSVAIGQEMLEWIDSQVKRKIFANRSHAIEYALEKLKNEETDKKK